MAKSKLYAGNIVGAVNSWAVICQVHGRRFGVDGQGAATDVTDVNRC